MKKTILSVVLAQVALLAPAAHAENPANTESPALRSLVNGNNQFGWELLQQVRNKDARSANVFVSPFSAFEALSMLYNGAAGSTRAEMSQVLGLKGLQLEDVNGSNKSILQSLQDPQTGFTLNVANSLWIRQGFKVVPSFTSNVERNYGASLTALDFASPSAVTEINGWVSQKTNGKIPSIVGRIRPDDLMFLINATYFKADWTIPFEKSRTEAQPFFKEDGSSSNVQTLARSGFIKHVLENDLEVASLTYGPTGAASFYVILPPKNVGLNDFVNSMTADRLEIALQDVDGVDAKQGALSMPKFKFSYATSLVAVLKAMGMPTAFDGRADFSGLTTQEQVLISDALQKTFVAVDEKGTEAAAVTSITIGRALARPPVNEFEMNVNRPFLFLIRDNKTHTVLFVGTVTNPVIE